VDTPAPLPETPGKLPVRRITSKQVKNASASNLALVNTDHYPIHITDDGAYNFENLMVSTPGGPRDRHGFFASHGSLNFDGCHFRNPSRVRSRDHLFGYAAGCREFLGGVNLIGHPDDAVQHDLAINIKSIDAKVRPEEPGRVCEAFEHDTFIVYGGLRNIIDATNDPGHEGVPSVERFRHGHLIWIDPHGDENGVIEPIQLQNCPLGWINRITVIDTKNRVKKARFVKADGGKVEVGEIRYHLPALVEPPAVFGVSGDVDMQAVGAPIGGMPAFSVEKIDELLSWVGGAT
ncbi:MAG: hypothetical protein ACIAXF_03040, partial [Phycisphaerales bacterium JB063]